MTLKREDQRRVDGGTGARRGGLRRLARTVVSGRTAALIRFDLVRLWARVRSPRRGLRPPVDRLHFGCGSRRVPGWLNVDVRGSEHDVDLAGGVLPWADGVFGAVAAQHVVEHLELRTELLPLLRELWRVSRPGAEICLSCPDLEKVCRMYLEDRGASLLQDRQTRFAVRAAEGMPPQHMVNLMFHQGGEHRNLFDFDLLRWALEQAGWEGCRRTDENGFRTRFPEFPLRNDDFSTLYVTAVRGPAGPRP
jgi:predicted SAM-dependent methyltransferase